ncbi:hypothetical protein BDV3_003587 [Batrachochytrium dendrobatidis]|uniref:Tetratricopeptide repeat and J domain-containing co-chaperone DNJ1 n=1 Tax=Batrachochytrium dendrobatidis (strain JEL423) TaxID=403673 RepID=A0A177WD18_BATDL|nr:hypothetical protein BDEG_21957 [Batrachochytrium dendrobatidis JEL423]
MLVNSLSLLWLLLLSYHQLSASVSATSTASEHMDNAKKLMSSGDFFKALDQFEAAIALEPNEYIYYFKRAAAYLTLNRYPNALADFSKVLELRPDHTASRVQKAKILLLEGSIDEASKESSWFDPDSSKQDVISLINDISYAKEASLQADEHLQAKNCEAAVEHLNNLIALTTFNYNSRISRAECFLLLNDRASAINDYKICAKIKPDSTSLYLKLSLLHLELGETAESIANSKECLRLDPDHRECIKQFKRVKKLDKELKNMAAFVEKRKWRSVIDILFGQNGVIKDFEGIGANSLNIQVYSYACRGYGALRKDIDAIDWCSRTLSLDAENVEALITRANALLEKEDYREAISDFQKAHEYDKNDPRISEGYNRAQKLQKQAGMRNYYKTLGVQRSATKKEIKKAFRKLAQQWHPDKYSGTLSRDQVQRKMSEINQAYEVLGNDELREQYDNGDDPNDPNNSSGGGNQFRGNNFFHQDGFHQHGFPFGGQGGGQFKFHFG